MLLGSNPDLLGATSSNVLPEEKIPDRKTTVHGIEEVPDLGVGPYEGSLDVRQRDVADLNVME
jgi:uncharacterized secreted protein with C-terminal beta-propeller domain